MFGSSPASDEWQMLGFSAVAKSLELNNFAMNV